MKLSSAISFKRIFVLKEVSVLCCWRVSIWKWSLEKCRSERAVKPYFQSKQRYQFECCTFVLPHKLFAVLPFLPCVLSITQRSPQYNVSVRSQACEAGRQMKKTLKRGNKTKRPLKGRWEETWQDIIGKQPCVVLLVDATSNQNPTGSSRWRMMHSTEMIHYCRWKYRGDCFFCFFSFFFALVVKYTDTDDVICVSWVPLLLVPS